MSDSEQRLLDEACTDVSNRRLVVNVMAFGDIETYICHHVDPVDNHAFDVRRPA